MADLIFNFITALDNRFLYENDDGQESFLSQAPQTMTLSSNHRDQLAPELQLGRLKQQGVPRFLGLKFSGIHDTNFSGVALIR